MKKYLFLLLLIGLIPLSHVSAITCNDAGAPANGYSYNREICIDHTKVGSTNTANFAMVISEQDAWLATTAHGGKVNNTMTQSGGAAITAPADVIFTTDNACATKVAGWEFETYNSTTGLANIWVNVGTISHTADTHIWECYGNAAVTTQQYTVSSTWDTNYKFVYHLPSATTAVDSTANTTATVSGGITANASAAIDGGITNDGTGNVQISALSSTPTALTVESWGYITGALQNYNGILDTRGAGNITGLAFNSANGSLSAYLNNVSAAYTNANYPSGANLQPYNNWDFMALTLDGTNAVLYYGQKGSALVSFSVGLSATFPALNAVWQIGYDDCCGRYFVGSQDEARVSYVLRSADAITAEYNNESATSTFYAIGTEQGGSTPSIITGIINFILFGEW